MFVTINDFTADQFTPTRWEAAEEKARFARQFIRFVESDFAEREFSERPLPAAGPDLRPHRPL